MENSASGKEYCHSSRSGSSNRFAILDMEKEKVVDNENTCNLENELEVSKEELCLS